MRLVRYLKPSIFIFENVEGLLTSNDGKDFEVVLREIADVGLYECEWQLLNTSWFLPQNRERVYFIGHLAERGGRKVFPIGENCGEVVECGWGLPQQNSSAIFAGQHKISRGMTLVKPCLTPNRPEKRQNGRRFKEDGEDSFTLTSQDIHGVMICQNLNKSEA